MLGKLRLIRIFSGDGPSRHSDTPDTLARRREENLMDIFKNIRHGAARTPGERVPTSQQKETAMRRSLFRGVLVLATTAAAAALIGAAAIPAGAVIAPPSPGHETTGRPAALALPGGLRAVRVAGSPRSLSVLPGWDNNGLVTLTSYDNENYAVTLQPTNSDGRIANDLYMWTFNDWSTQVFDQLFYAGGAEPDQVYVSQYNGECINVPGDSTMSGKQLIVYSCTAGKTLNGYSINAQFFANVTAFYSVLELWYDNDLAMAIGSDFPGNGAYVITYGTNDSNPKEQWVPATP
jgi:hypothetical protein